MKIYFHMNIESFSNSYLVVNEETKIALIVDPGKITDTIINQLEDNGYKLTSVLITHNHTGHTRGISTLKKIYGITVYSAESELNGEPTNTIKGEGTLSIGGLSVKYFNLPGHSADSMVYQIENVLFTGDTIEAGKIANTNSNYSKMILINGIKQKIFTKPGDTVIMPGHGPMTSVAVEKAFNMDLSGD